MEPDSGASGGSWIYPANQGCDQLGKFLKLPSKWQDFDVRTTRAPSREAGCRCKHSLPFRLPSGFASDGAEENQPGTDGLRLCLLQRGGAGADALHFQVLVSALVLLLVQKTRTSGGKQTMRSPTRPRNERG